MSGSTPGVPIWFVVLALALVVVAKVGGRSAFQSTILLAVLLLLEYFLSHWLGTGAGYGFVGLVAIGAVAVWKIRRKNRKT